MPPSSGYEQAKESDMFVPYIKTLCIFADPEYYHPDSLPGG